jgi:sugar O-acyltransferase (sialic acid O-acetyltransferase NeuD family)
MAALTKARGNKNNNIIFIIGASGHGIVAADIALKMNKWQQIAFLDDDHGICSAIGIKVIGRTEDAFSLIPDGDIFVAIGDNSTREVLQSRLEAAGANIATLIHPTAVIGNHVEIGAGTVVMAGAVINCCSRIGKGCIVNTAATLDHDNILGNYAHISPGAHLAGTVSIGKGSWLGIGSIVVNNITITDGCLIGAGAVVVKDITEAGTYIGVPARRV